jgi:transglutaminase/protease-like cytokinesis protein 3
VTGHTNHAWNAVKVDGRWQLVDCTWGAGVVEGHAYVRRFNPFYFLTPPLAFSWLHFPLDPRWQLRDPPLSLAEFEKLPLVRDPFFEYGLELVSHPSAIIRTSTHRTTVRIATPPDVALLATALCPPDATTPAEIRDQARHGRHSLSIDTRGAGDCVVRIFARRASERTPGQAVFRWALDYRLLASGGPE